jgi:hypothetical protein
MSTLLQASTMPTSSFKAMPTLSFKAMSTLSFKDMSTLSFKPTLTSGQWHLDINKDRAIMTLTLEHDARTEK